MSASEKLIEYCRENLSQARFEHTERVFSTALSINQTHNLGIATEDIALAAFGHDIARELPIEIALLLTKLCELPVNHWEEEFPMFCHNKAGALLLQKLFNVDKPEILAAIRNHTLGDKGMSDLEKIIYAADFLEPKRSYISDAERKNYLKMPLNEMVYSIGLLINSYLEKNQKPILPPSKAMMEELKHLIAL